MERSMRIAVILRRFGLLMAMGVFAAPATAGETEVIDASAQRESNGRYTVSATIRHGDEGWEHYVDRFEILSPDGTLLGARYLGHPHVTEQPFTRTATSVNVPKGVREVRIRAHDKLHGFGGKEFILKLPE